MKPSLHADKPQQFFSSYMSGLKVGLTGSLEGMFYEIKGKVKYKGKDTESTWYWEEWLLESPSGNVWLEYDEGQFSLYTPVEPYRSADPVDMLRVGDYLELIAAQTIRINERDAGEIVEVEGDVGWKARLGERIDYVEAKDMNEGYCVEWDDSSTEYYLTKKIHTNIVYDAFGLHHLIENQKQKDKVIQKHRFHALLVALCSIPFFISVLWALLQGGITHKVVVPLSQALQPDGVITAPFYLDLEGKSHHLKIASRPSGKGVWSWAQASILNDQQQPMVTVSGDFWSEGGESRTSHSLTFLLKKSGLYNIKVEADKSAHTITNGVVVSIKEDVVTIRYFFAAGVLYCLGLLVIGLKIGTIQKIPLIVWNETTI